MKVSGSLLGVCTVVWGRIKTLSLKLRARSRVAVSLAQRKGLHFQAEGSGGAADVDRWLHKEDRTPKRLML